MTRNLSDAKRIWLHIAASIVVLVGLGTCARLGAQVVGATLSGTITDQSGGVVPNAQISIRNTATGDTRNVTTNADGIYSAANLQPGTYDIAISAAGFSKAVQSGLTLTVGAQQTLNLTMQVGQASQTVEVAAEAPTMNLENAAIGSNIAEKAVKELPLNGRSWSDLATLSPGVYALHTQLTQARDLWSRGFGSQLTISGARPQQNNYRVDGVSVNDPTNGGPGSLLGGNMGVDAISEFSVLTTNYSTEYGRASGGVINATTKSGTNRFHGNAYEFLRNSALDASNFFDNANGLKKPPFRRNQFGVSAGGPIRKDKTFIFGDYEGLRQFLGQTQASIVPSAAALSGLLCSLCATPVQLPAIAGKTDANGIDLKVLPYLNAFWPKSSVPNPNDVKGDTNIFAFGRNIITPENYFIIRADHRFSERDGLHGTYYYDYNHQTQPDEMNNRSQLNVVNRQFATMEETHTFGSNFVNSVRGGLNRTFLGGPVSSIAINPAAADTALGFAPGWSAGLIYASPLQTFFGGLTGAAPQINAWTSIQGYDDASLLKGKHTLKFGVNVERMRANMIAQPRPGGQFNFGNLASFLTNGDIQYGSVAINADLSLVPVTRDYRQTIFGAYFQDDVRLRPNLTLNLGLRYEPATVPVEIHGRMGSLLTPNDPFPAIANPAQVSPLVDCSACPKLVGTYFKNNMLHDFEPRVGFAWDPFKTGKTSIRGGFGMYDQLTLITHVRSQIAGNFPFNPGGNAGNLLPGSFGGWPSFGGSCPSPAAFCQITQSGTDSKRAGIIERAPKRAYVMQYNFSVQRAITPNFTAMIGYVGSHGVHGNTADDDFNMVPPTASPLGYLWPCETGALPYSPSATVGNINACFNGGGPAASPFPEFNTHVHRENGVFFRNSSVYNGLEVQLTRNMSHGFQIQGSFTWQKSLDTASASAVGDQFTTGISSLFLFGPNLTRARSEFNVGRVMNVSYLWEIPTPKSLTGFAGTALGGWQLGGLFSLTDGAPFTPLMNGDALGLQNTDAFAYPDVLRGAPGCNSLTNPGNPNHYLKVECFGLPPIVQFQGLNWIRLGTSGRNDVTGPGLQNFDLSVVKNTHVPRISETFNVQFRAEAFNAFNHANFNPLGAASGNNVILNPFAFNPSVPGSEVASTGAVGAGDFTATTSRQMQFALKFIW
jgi:hypothetical protein